MNSGRPTKYKSEYCKTAQKLTELGGTLPDLAAAFDVHPDSISEWMSKHPKFSESIKKARLAADTKVERSLYERALGYSHADTHISNFHGEITATPITKHYAPSEVACIFWLKNRKPKEWRDKQELVHENPDGSALISADIIAAAAKLAKS